MHPDEVACKELWMKAFGDDEQFADSFIMRYYSRRRMLTAEAGGRMAAMLHLLPFRTELGRTTYIYGVATDPAFRGRGLASQLMREAMRSSRSARRCRAPHPDARQGVAPGILRTLRVRWRRSGEVRFRRPLRLRHGRRGRRPGDGLAARLLGSAPRTAHRLLAFIASGTHLRERLFGLRRNPPATLPLPAQATARPGAAGTGSDNTSGSARHSSPPRRFPNCRRRKTDARQFRFTTIPQIKGNEKEMKGKWQIYQTKHD